MANLSIEPNVEFMRYSRRWKKMRDIIDGEDRLKDNDLRIVGYSQGTSQVQSYDVLSNSNIHSYLRIINPSDKSAYNKERNAGYICGARLFNATSRTLDGLMGMLFKHESDKPELGELEYLLKNIDGSGTTIDQQAKGVASDTLSLGRDGLLTDMPRKETGGQVSMADVEGGFRPSIKEYKAESIIDWHESTIDGVMTLDLVVLLEVIYDFADDDKLQIKRTPTNRYRIYRLKDSVVSVQVYKESNGSLDLTEEVAVSGPNGIPLSRIPFSFIGSINNTPDIDRIPLEPVADLNLGQYQESANLSSSSYQLSAAQPWVADDNYQTFNSSENDSGGDSEIELGEQAVFILGTGGTYNVTAAPANTMASELVKTYGEQMIEAGAQLVTSGGGAETAEAARIKHGSNMSILHMVAENISDAYNKAFGFAAIFMGVEFDEDSPLKMNTDFFESKLTPDDLRAVIEAWQSGAISKPVLDRHLVKGKVIPKDVDLKAMNTEIETEDTGPDLDGPDLDEKVASSDV